MTILTLWRELRARGIALSVEGGRLRYSAPVGAMTRDLRTLLRLWKPTLVAMLEGADVSNLLLPKAWSQRASVRAGTMEGCDPRPVD